MCQIKEIRCPFLFALLGEIRDNFIGRQLIYVAVVIVAVMREKNCLIVYDVNWVVTL